ncbi:MAG: AraC family transcriptional regulator [Victivallaceae bacterium]|nr:AraC family transcriptional regulator [Victivallaceae bacterium]
MNGTKKKLPIYCLGELTEPQREVALTLQRWSPDREAMLHIHDFTELVFVADGYGVNQVNSRSYPIRAGDVAVIREGATHSFHTASELKIYNLMFRPEKYFDEQTLRVLRESEVYRNLFEGEKRENAPEKLSLSPASAAEFRAVLEKLDAELKSPEVNAASRLTVQGLLLLLLGMLVRDGKRPPEHIPDQAYRQLSKILAYVNLHFTEDLSLESVAEIVHLSPNYLGNFFKLHTGITLFRYLSVLRMEEAERLFASHPQWNVTQVAERCGFADPSYFARCYRRYTAHSPSETRKKHAFLSRTSVNSARKSK